MATQQQNGKASTDETMIGIPSQFCSVCGDNSTGIHFGGNSCESCKAFFRRSVQCNRYQNYKCSNEEQCPVNIVTRKVCQFCRYNKCTKIGMKPKWVLSDQEREEKYGARRKRTKDPRTNEEDPEIYKFLSKEEKLLIEDIAHGLYQSRATYPLQFPSQLKQYLSSLTPPTSNPATSLPPTGEKPANPSANFLIIPIQRLVLFARMLKDFDLFSEDDKVNLLKGSAIEITVCSSNTLFNPKTQTFSNYISRDQRASVDEQAIPLDPLLKRVWGEDLFERTKHFLISMCHLHIDEVTSTLLVPVILFSPDRSNVINVSLVKKLQSKYASLLLKYMNWRYGVDKANSIYPKLLLQIINVRALGLSHAEVIQKVMSTSSVNPLVQEVTSRQIPTGPTVHSRSSSSSIPSTTSEKNSMDVDKTSSVESEPPSDDEDNHRRRGLTSNDDGYLNDEDFDETDPTSIWRKRRKLSSAVENELTNFENERIHSPFGITSTRARNETRTSSSRDSSKVSDPTNLARRPHDHQVPSFISTSQVDEAHRSFSLRSPSVRHLPPKKQNSLVHRDSLTDPTHPMSPSTITDHSSNHSHISSAPSINSPRSVQSFDEPLTSQFSRLPLPVHHLTTNSEHDPRPFSLGTQSSPVGPPVNPMIPVGSVLGPEEQQLISAIQAHPNKRDLVMTLLRQLNETNGSSNVDQYTRHPYHQR